MNVCIGRSSDVSFRFTKVREVNCWQVLEYFVCIMCAFVLCASEKY